MDNSWSYKMKRPCPNCGAPMKESKVLSLTRGPASQMPGTVQCTEEEWERLSGEMHESTPFDPDLLEKYGQDKWECERCRLTMRGEHKIVAMPDSLW